MDRILSRRVLAACLGAGALLAAGCEIRPTYPRAQLTESLRKILEQEHVEASVRFIDHTLAVQFAYPGALIQANNQITIGPAFDEAARKALMATHRVLLSSDAEIRFYVLLLSDPGMPGAYLTMIRYVDDVRRAYANMLDTPEMFDRTVFDLNVIGPRPLTLEQYVPRDIRLGEFLSWQLSRRIQRALAQELQESGVAAVGRCGGQFQDGQFAFTLDVSPIASGALDEETLRKAFHISTNMVAKVLSSYAFDSFDSVRLIHPMTGRHLILPKTHLDVFR